MKKIVLLLFGVISLLLAISRPALAASITVNTTAQSPGQTGDCTLGEAIEAANTDQAVDGCLAGSGADTITVPAGTYVLDAVDNSTSFVGALGLPLVAGDMTISGAGADSTIIQRSANAPAFRILYLAGDNNVVQGITISGGMDEGAFIKSAGIGTEDSSHVTLDHVVVVNNTGEGIGTLGDLIIEDSEIRDNTGDGILGGTAHAHPLKTISVLDSTVTGNGGAGIWAVQSDLTIQDSNFSNNAADGIAITSTALTLSHSTVAHNGGAGITGAQGSNFSSSKAAVEIANSSIFSNHARGISITGMSGGSVNLVNTTLAQNGGAILLKKSKTTVKITNSTIAANHAKHSAAISQTKSTGKLTLLNSILAENTTKQGPGCTGTITSLGHNIFGTKDPCSVTLHKGDMTQDPHLGVWMDDGTPGNGHYPLLPASPAIDHANTAKCPATDQLNDSRVGGCDTGAIEYIP